MGVQNKVKDRIRHLCYYIWDTRTTCSVWWSPNVLTQYFHKQAIDYVGKDLAENIKELIHRTKIYSGLISKSVRRMEELLQFIKLARGGIIGK